jgi:Dyp-type peroxidase family
MIDDGTAATGESIARAAAKSASGASFADSQEPVLELNEIQGNVVPGFNKPYEGFVFLEIHAAPDAKLWLTQQAGSVTTAAHVIGFRRARRLALRSHGLSVPSVSSAWFNLAISAAGLRKLGADTDGFHDRAFRAGMQARSDVLGDPTDPSDLGSPANWVIGGPNRIPDLLVALAHDTSEGLTVALNKLTAGLPAALTVMRVERGLRLPAPWQAYEHFGFRDGISQPGIRGRASNSPDDFLTRRYDPNLPDQGWPGQDLLWPGEILFGYPTEPIHQGDPPGPISTAGPAWSRNGSYLVLRRFVQDTAGFETFLEQSCSRIRLSFPDLAEVDTESLAARLLGRWRSGAPISRTPLIDVPLLGEQEQFSDYFKFQSAEPPRESDPYPGAPADPNGMRCPFASHIRKVNPRDGGSEGAIRHRILRRGIPFGPPHPDPAEKGMLFVCYQASIEKQFEFIIHQWIVQANEPIAGAGVDALLGIGARVALVTLPDSQGVLQHVALAVNKRFVTPTGGDYFFAPSLQGIGRLSA